LINVLVVVAAMMSAFAIVVALQPSDFRVTRTATISAPPAVVFDQVNELHKWEAWSPWAKRDPNVKNTFEGPSAGTGAMFGWAGNSEVGEGRMTIIESRPDEIIRLKLEFIKPFEDTSTAEFKFEPKDGRTMVTWSMYGENDFISKAFGLFMDMDKMIGGDFEQGLAQIKEIAETPAAPSSPASQASR
jgi:uncharacterized protein YndB with AHSA1/START domain